MFWMIVMLILLIPLASIVLDSQLGRALAARVEGRGLTGGDSVTQERIAYLEGEVDRLASELSRVSEESRFVQQLLTERSGEDAEPRELAPGDELP